VYARSADDAESVAWTAAPLGGIDFALGARGTRLVYTAEGDEGATGAATYDHRIADHPRFEMLQSRRDGIAQCGLVAGARGDVDQPDQIVDEAHACTPNTRSASLSEVLRSVDSVRWPTMRAHCKS